MVILNSKKVSFILILSMLFQLTTFSQNSSTNSGGQIEQIQPILIVIPYTVKGQNIRTVLEDAEHGPEKRIAISRVKEAFDSRGFTTYDFIATLKKAETAGVFSMDAQGDYKEKILQMSGADIYVEVDITAPQRNQSGREVHINMQGFETATGRSLANKDAFSGKFFTDDISKLAGKAIDLMKEDFLNVLQNKFTDIVNNGRSVYMEFVLDPNSKLTFQSEVGKNGDLLSESIMDWMRKNAFKGQAKKGSSTALKIIYDDVKIPLKDQETKENYEIESFGRMIRKYLKSIDASATLEYPRGQIIVTIK